MPMTPGQMMMRSNYRRHRGCVAPAVVMVAVAAWMLERRQQFALKAVTSEHLERIFEATTTTRGTRWSAAAAFVCMPICNAPLVKKMSAARGVAPKLLRAERFQADWAFVVPVEIAMYHQDFRSRHPAEDTVQGHARGWGSNSASRRRHRRAPSRATREAPPRQGATAAAEGGVSLQGRRVAINNRRRKVRSLSGSLNRCIQGLVHFSRLPRLYSFLQRSAVPPLSGWFYLRRPERGG